jgi:O-antigen ligase
MTFMPRYEIPGEPSAPVTPHNSLLYVASESGVFAALALALAIVLALRFVANRRALILAPTLGFLAFTVNAMTTNLFSIASMAIGAWMLAPAVAALLRGDHSAGSVMHGGTDDEATGSPAPGSPAPGSPAPGSPAEVSR